MKYLLIAAIAYFAVGFLEEAPVVVQQPDSRTSVNEGVCDSLQGSKPGLSVPYQIILANNNKKMRAGDSAMLCDKPPCPCWNKSDLESALPKPARILNVDSYNRLYPKLRSRSL